MSDLASRRCRPCATGTPPLSRERCEQLLGQLGDWTVREGAGELRRTFEFKNYWRTMAFVNAVAWIAHTEDHHPDLEVGYNTCVVRYSTHSVGGLSDNDFICAAKVDDLVRNG